MILPPLAELSRKLKDSTKAQRILVIAGLTVFAIAGTAVVLSGNTKEEISKKNNLASAPSFPDLLKPASEIKIGTQKYISPCQAFTFEDVQKIYGSATDDSSYSTKFFDLSVPENTVSGDSTYCQYRLSNSKVKIVDLTIQQGISAEDLSNVNRSFALLRQTKITEANRIFNTAADNSENKAAQELVTSLLKSDKVYQKNSSYSLRQASGGIDQPTLNSMILSNGETFYFIYGNAVFQLRISPATGKGTLAERDEKTIVEGLEKIKLSIDTIKRTVDNKNLNQSPGPTILGSTDKYGSTKLLQPCLVLDRGVFKAITGKDQNSTTTMSSLPFNVAKTRVGTKDGIKGLSSNSCERSYGFAGPSVENRDVTLILDIRYDMSSEAASKYIRDPFGAADEDDTPLTTNADEAFMVRAPGFESKPYYLFRVGPYISIINIYYASDPTPRNPTTAEYVQAINTLTASIKQQSGLK